MGNKGILLCGHGSRSAETLQEFELFANKLKVRFPEKFTEENALNRNLEQERKTLEK